MKANFQIIENNDKDYEFKDSKTGDDVELKRFQLKGVLQLGDSACMADFTVNRSEFKQADYPLGTVVEVELQPTYSAKHKTMIIEFKGLA